MIYGLIEQEIDAYGQIDPVFIQKNVDSNALRPSLTGR